MYCALSAVDTQGKQRSIVDTYTKPSPSTVKKTMTCEFEEKISSDVETENIATNPSPTEETLMASSNKPTTAGKKQSRRAKWENNPKSSAKELRNKETNTRSTTTAIKPRLDESCMYYYRTSIISHCNYSALYGKRVNGDE
ncbi:hypothetical protein U1Q18_051895 [Sarracenia purpurea var. burkii]